MVDRDKTQRKTQRKTQSKTQSRTQSKTQRTVIRSTNLSFCLLQQLAQHTPNTNPDLDEEGHPQVPHSQAQTLLHVVPPPPPSQHPHMPSLEDTSMAEQSPTLQGRQEIPMSPDSPPTMGSHSHSITPPPNITVHDITSPSDITVVATPPIHMLEEKQVRIKKRSGDPDGIALGELVFTKSLFKWSQERCIRGLVVT